MASFEHYGASLESPASSAEAITPSDVAPLATPSRSIYVGVTGDVSVVMLDGTTATFIGMVAGMAYPLRVSKVMATGTSATNLISLT